MEQKLTSKELMQRVRFAETELQLIMEKQRHFRELATNIGVNLTGMPGGQKGASKVETGAVNIVDLIAGLDAKALEYTTLILQAEDLIDKIPHDNLRKVLTLRYILGHSWKEIQAAMGYKDEKSVYHCHGFALKELQRIMYPEVMEEENNEGVRED